MRVPFEWLVAVRYLREGRAQSLLILVGRRRRRRRDRLPLRAHQRPAGEPHRANARHAGPRRPAAAGRDAAAVARPDRGGRPVVARPAAGPAPCARSSSGSRRSTQSSACRALPPSRRRVSGAAFARLGHGEPLHPAPRRRARELQSHHRHEREDGRRAVPGDAAATRSIGVELARNLGLTVGDKLRVSTPDDRAEVFTVAGSSTSATRT